MRTRESDGALRTDLALRALRSDRTHEADGLIPRTYSGFRNAAEEAGISRLYGGIHYRAAIELGLRHPERVAGLRAKWQAWAERVGAREAAAIAALP